MRALQVVPLLLLVLVAACASGQKTEDPSNPPPPQTTVEVDNRKTVDVNLYVMNGAQRVRLGTVPAITTRNFVIPPHLIGRADRIRFGVEIIGSDQGFSSDQEMPVVAGEQLTLTLQ
jgi:hypothetical protein